MWEGQVVGPDDPVSGRRRLCPTTVQGTTGGDEWVQPGVRTGRVE